MAKRTSSGRTRAPLPRPAIASGSSSTEDEEDLSDEEFIVGSAPSTSTQAQVKACSKCKEVKAIGEFWQDPTKKSGRTSWCKSCFSACAEARKKAGHVKVDDKVCSICKERKPADAFMKDSRRLTGLDARCRECRKKQHHEKKLKNIEAGNQTWPEKECKRCHVVKLAKHFKRHAYTKSGLDSWCKDCCRERRQEQQRAKQQQQPAQPAPHIKTCAACNQVKETTEFARDRSQTDGFCRRCKECEKVYRHSKRVCPTPPLSPGHSRPATPLELSAPASPTFMMATAPAWPAGPSTTSSLTRQLQPTSGQLLPSYLGQVDLNTLLQQQHTLGGPAITTGAANTRSPFARATSPPLMGIGMLPPALAPAPAQQHPLGIMSDASFAKEFGISLGPQLAITELSLDAIGTRQPPPAAGTTPTTSTTTGTAIQQQHHQPWSTSRPELSLPGHDWAVPDSSFGLAVPLPDTSLTMLLKALPGDSTGLQIDPNRQVSTPALQPPVQPLPATLHHPAQPGSSSAPEPAQSQPSWVRAEALAGLPAGQPGRTTLADQLSKVLPPPDETLLESLEQFSSLAGMRADSLLGASRVHSRPLPNPSLLASPRSQAVTQAAPGPADAHQTHGAAAEPMIRDDSLVRSFLDGFGDQQPANEQQPQQPAVAMAPPAAQPAAQRPRGPIRSAFTAAGPSILGKLSPSLVAADAASGGAGVSATTGAAATSTRDVSGAVAASGASAADALPSFMAGNTWCFSAPSDVGLAPLPTPHLDTEMDRLGSLSLKAGMTMESFMPNTGPT